ncbi:MAG: hypothetical protein A2Y38_25840 [Spirochaetes bacterium GWB1_59_5]|nr:MAG: hypothetical protein A2Y38_25840 [Spirochaetes bacterium GWB1_59_5]
MSNFPYNVTDPFEMIDRLKDYHTEKGDLDKYVDHLAGQLKTAWAHMDAAGAALTEAIGDDSWKRNKWDRDFYVDGNEVNPDGLVAGIKRLARLLESERKAHAVSLARLGEVPREAA